MAALQRLLTTVALVGFVWLLALAVLGGFFNLDTDPLTIDTPGAGWLPLPSALAIGGLLASGIVSQGARLPSGIAARRHARRVRRTLREQVGDVADDLVIAPVEQVLGDHEEMARLLSIVRA